MKALFNLAPFTCLRLLRTPPARLGIVIEGALLKTLRYIQRYINIPRWVKGLSSSFYFFFLLHYTPSSFSRVVFLSTLSYFFKNTFSEAFSSDIPNLEKSISAANPTREENSLSRVKKRVSSQRCIALSFMQSSILLA